MRIDLPNGSFLDLADGWSFDGLQTDSYRNTTMFAIRQAAVLENPLLRQSFADHAQHNVEMLLQCIEDLRRRLDSKETL
jgi:hypothetical protein